MPRPKVPLLEPSGVVDAALALIDRDGLEAFSMRRLGAALGVSGPALYHHFPDKEAILHGVRLRVIESARAAERDAAGEPWPDHLRRTTAAYRRVLLGHPNVAPIMAPSVLLRPFSLVLRDRVAAKLLDGGVPARLVVPIIDSVETLAYGSALLNPDREPPRRRLALRPDDRVPALAAAVRAAPGSADRVFALQLDALVTGWAAAVAEAVA